MFSRVLPALRTVNRRVHFGVIPAFAAGSFAKSMTARCFATVGDDSHPDFQKKETAAPKPVDYTATIKVLEKLVAENKVVVFMKGEPDAPQCGYSGRTMEALEKVGLYEFTFVNVLEHEVAREAVKKMTDWPTIPQVFIAGEFVGGCDIIEQMLKSGELKEALETAGVELEK